MLVVLVGIIQISIHMKDWQYTKMSLASTEQMYFEHFNTWYRYSSCIPRSIFRSTFERTRGNKLINHKFYLINIKEAELSLCKAKGELQKRKCPVIDTIQNFSLEKLSTYLGNKNKKWGNKIYGPAPKESGWG